MSGNNGNNGRYIDFGKQTFNKYRAEIKNIKLLSDEDEKQMNLRMRNAFDKLIETIIESKEDEFSRLKNYFKKIKLKDCEKKNKCPCGIVPRQKIVKIIENTLKQISKNSQNKNTITVCADCEKYITQIKKAVNIMVECNLRLVNSATWEIKAQYYVPDSLHIMDLIQAGNIGLIRAIYPFYYKLGRISTYVKWEIKQTMERKIREGSIIKLPFKIWGLERRCRIALSWAKKEGKNLKTVKDAALSLGLSEEEAKIMQELPQTPKSLSHKIGDNEENELEGIISDSSIVPFEITVADSKITEKIRALVRNGDLSPREQKIICLRFGIGEKDENTLEEIGKIFNISRERIRQIEGVAKIKLRIAAKKENLQQLL
ncbi:sigma-70 family RNA polymerase sigma factor [bacterium]|nr:sigma-70 family RNA polymerase sigma factor [bacterium]